MLRQKEYDLLIEKFERNHMEGYEKWFYQNVNCEINDNTGIEPRWRKGIRLFSNAKNYVLIAVEKGIVYKVSINNFRMIDDK